MPNSYGSSKQNTGKQQATTAMSKRKHNDDARPKAPASYAGDDARKLADEIENALVRFGKGNPHHHVKRMSFFEGELLLIAQSLRRRSRRMAISAGHDDGR